MAAAVDEFEEFRTLAFSNIKCRYATSRDDCSNMEDSQRLQNKMRMRASFKSDSAYRASRRQKQEQESMAKRMAEISLRKPDIPIGESTISVFGSTDEIDCDFPDHPQTIHVGHDPGPRTCLSPTRSAMDSPRHSPRVQSPTSHHHRSRSCRVKASTAASNHDIHDAYFAQSGPRQRTYSMPSKSKYRRPRVNAQSQEEDEEAEEEATRKAHKDRQDEFYRIRTFSTSTKGIVNRGDSFKRKPASKQSSLDGAAMDSPRARTQSTTSRDSSLAGSVESLGSSRTHNVLVMGNTGVGKTAMIRQFMTSEFIGNTEVSATGQSEGSCPSVSVLMDELESTLEFAELPDAEDVTSDAGAEAFIVVYAVNDRESYDDAVMCLHELRKRELLAKTATILVANKGDMVRGREVEEEEAKVMAVRYGSKYIEISATLNLKVDELLAGTLKQIRLNDKRIHALRTKKKSKNAPDNGCIPQPRGIVGKLFGKNTHVNRSCDNLQVI